MIAQTLNLRRRTRPSPQLSITRQQRFSNNKGYEKPIFYRNVK